MFDASTWEIWGALLNGACLVEIDKTTLLSTRDFARALARQRVTVMFLTTALLHHHARSDASIFRDLRGLLFGGEAADPRLVRRVCEAGPPGAFIHVYGPTETTTFATWHRVESVPEDACSVLIGRPIANTSAYVLDAGGRPVARGAVGTLFVGGDGVALGYINAPELDREWFVPDPFSPDPAARMYATGDLVRVLDEGCIDFVGRDDDQIKLSGYRVELGEIEAALRTHAAVVDAAVAVYADEHGQKRLVAFVVASALALASDTEIEIHLSRRLPVYMVPQQIVRVETLPLSPNGKIDRRSLAAPTRSDVVPASTGASAAAEGERAAVAARIWSDVLGVDPVRPDDDFLSQGGHSLRAMQIVARLRAALGVEVSVRTLYEARSFAEWVERQLPSTPRVIAAAADDELWQALVEIEALDDEEVRRELAA